VHLRERGEAAAFADFTPVGPTTITSDNYKCADADGR
jgi:hypothetical protein